LGAGERKLALGLPLRCIEVCHALEEHPVQIVQPFREPLVLAWPIHVVLRVHLCERRGDATVLARRQVLPDQLMTKFTLNRLFLVLEETEKRFGMLA
jgi:hypothetical protein